MVLIKGNWIEDNELVKLSKYCFAAMSIVAEKLETTQDEITLCQFYQKNLMVCFCFMIGAQRAQVIESMSIHNLLFDSGMFKIFKT